jgi:aspartate 1-decarboxylase
MLVTMMKGKIHRATVTEADLHYEGSISIDSELIEAAGLFVNERVEIYNIDNGARFATYVIDGGRGTGTIGLNGAAARMVMPGDRVIIVAYAQMDEAEARSFEPRVVFVDAKNHPKVVERTSGRAVELV